MVVKLNLYKKCFSQKTINVDTNKNIYATGVGYYSTDEKHRYRYTLEINILSKTQEKKSLAVIMFNPSESGEGKNGIFVDQTVTNIIKIANDTGYNSIKILNLFTIINPKQDEVEKNEPINIEFIEQEIVDFENILVAWGKEGEAHINRTNNRKNLIEILKTKKLYTFCRNKNKKYPKHPARLDIDCCRNCYGRCGKFTLENYVLN